MDRLDTILVLKGITDNRIAKSVKQSDQETQILTDSLSQLIAVETIIKSSTDGSTITESDNNLIDKVIHDSKALFASEELIPLDPNKWTEDQLPKNLYLSNLIGSVNFHLPSQPKKSSSKTVSYDPVSFSLRGKNYLKDGKKVILPKQFNLMYFEKIKSSSPLFLLRGIQVVQKSELSFHVAQEKWCGLPRHSDQSNEWLVVNYMVSITPHLLI